MFVKNTRGYYAGTGQRASGAFLMVFNHYADKSPPAASLGSSVKADPCSRCGETHDALRAAVRHVRMRQRGHFMMGEAFLLGERIALSGTYGSDGLPLDCSNAVWERLMPLPQALVEQFWHGGGHNSAGAEGPAILAWAQENLRALQQAAKLKRK